MGKSNQEIAARRQLKNGLSATRLTVLRTAKGCNRRPASVQQPGYWTLADFLKIPTLDVNGAGKDTRQ